MFAKEVAAIWAARAALDEVTELGEPQSNTGGTAHFDTAADTLEAWSESTRPQEYQNCVGSFGHGC